MKDQVRLAILSCAHPHSAAWLNVARLMGNLEIVAIWDDNAARGLATAQESGIAFEPDLGAVLARADVDAVALASEISKHAELVTLAAQAGKHIVCEKPMAFTLADCDTMIEAVERAGVKFYQIYPMRWDPVNQRIKELVASGSLGKISMVRKRHGHFYGLKWQETVPDIWFANRDLAGLGAFLDEGIHAIDWMRWILGEPTSVMAQIDTVGTRFEVDDLGAAIYRFEDRSMMLLHASWLDQSATNTTEIYGSKGTLIQSHTDGASARGIGETSSPLKVYWAETGGWQVYDIPVHFPRNQEAVFKPFVDCLLKDQEPPVTMYDGRRAVELVLAAYQSAREGRLVSIE